VAVALGAYTEVHGGNVYAWTFDVFTQNGNYSDDPDVDLPFVFSDDGTSVEFTFFNLSTVECSITGIYFDDGSLLGLSSLDESSGVDFSTPATPEELPSGNTLCPPFVTTQQFSASSDPPRFANGINSSPAGDWLKIIFELSDLASADDINAELLSGELRIGAHIQGFPDGSSESGIGTPEPATVLLGAFAVIVLAGRHRQ
jgi:hypothetical protein